MALMCCFASGLSAQQSDNTTGVVVASGFSITPPLSELFAANPVDPSNLYGEQESKDRQHRIPTEFVFGPENGPQYANEPSSIQEP